MEELAAKFIAIAASTNAEEINAISAEIIEAEKDLSIVALYVQMLLNPGLDFKAKFQVACRIKNICCKNRRDLITCEFMEDVKNGFLEYLPNENHNPSRNEIYAAIEELTQTNDFPWPELPQFALGLVESEQSEKNVDISLNILSAAVFSIPYEALTELIPPMNDIIVNAIQTNSDLLIKDAAHLFTNTVNVLQEVLPEALQPAFQLIIETFHAALQAPTQRAAILSNEIERSITEAGVINVPELVPVLLGMIDESVLDTNADHICVIITKCASLFTQDLRENLGDIISALIKCSQIAFSPEKDVNDLINFTEGFCAILENINPSKLFDDITGLLEPEDEGSYYAILLLLNAFIANNVDVALKRLSFFMRKSLDAFEDEYSESIKIQAITNIDDLLNSAPSMLDPFNEEIFTKIIEEAQKEVSPDYALKLVRALGSALSFVTVKPEWYGNIWELLSNWVSEESLAAEVLDTLSCFISTAQEGIGELAEPILTLISESLESENSSVKANGIIALGHLISIYPDMEQISTAVQTICEAAQVEGDLELNSAAISAFNAMIGSKMTGIEEILVYGIDLAQRSLDFEGIDKIFDINDDDQMDEDADHSSSQKYIDMFVTSIDFLRQVFKFYPGLIDEERAEQIDTILNGLLAINRSEILTAVAKALYQACIKYNKDANELLENISCLKEAFDTKPCGTFFNIARKLIKVKVGEEYIVADELVAQTLGEALKGMKRLLPSQGNVEEVDEEAEDEDIKNEESSYSETLLGNIYAFVVEVIKQRPACIENPGQIIDVCVKASKMKDEAETSASTQIIAAFFQGDHESLPPLFKKAGINLVVESISEIQGEYPPYNINTLRVILNAKPDYLSNYLERIMESISPFLELENEGQAYFAQTQASIVAFLFTLMRYEILPDVETYLPLMIQALPLTKGFGDAADVIYSSCLELLGKGEEIGELAEPIAIGITKTLSYTDIELEKLGVSSELVQRMITVITPQAETLAASAELSEAEQERLSKRLQPSQ